MHDDVTVSTIVIAQLAMLHCSLMFCKEHRYRNLTL